ncbi:hypothetical protein B0H13DRAFT_1883571 [Mycena leptocephala]|nr:hypothetical protein B0H13DRAFT_1883571 [Mycena leptocephala]
MGLLKMWDIPPWFLNMWDIPPGSVEDVGHPAMVSEYAGHPAWFWYKATNKCTKKVLQSGWFIPSLRALIQNHQAQAESVPIWLQKVHFVQWGSVCGPANKTGIWAIPGKNFGPACSRWDIPP